MDGALLSTLRRAETEDAADISAVILAALHDTNAKDYSPDIIERVSHSFSPSAVKNLIAKREVYVALIDNRIVGTASLDSEAVRTVFVSPASQGRGIGRQLMTKLEQRARDREFVRLVAPATITAEAFYAKFGFKPIREMYEGAEKTIVMELRL